MYQILLIEDSIDSCAVVQQALANSGLQIRVTHSNQEALTLLRQKGYRPDLVLLDLMLPDGTGLQILNYLNSDPSTQSIPVMLISSTHDVTFKVTAFSLGAEDYVTKPIDPIELRARVEMRLRKSIRHTQNRDVIKRNFLELQIPLMRAQILYDGKGHLLDLTLKEFKILCFLAQHESEVFSRFQLVKSIWGESINILDRTIDSHICSIRKKLGPYSNYIQSIPGVGYRFYSGVGDEQSPDVPSEAPLQSNA